MDVQKMQESARQMQDEITQAEESMGSFATIAKSNDGLVQIEMDGYHHVKNIYIHEDSWGGNKTKIGGSIAEAFNKAIDQVDIELEKKMSAIVYKYTEEAIEDEKKEAEEKHRN